MQNNLDLNTFFKKGVGFGNVDDKLSNRTVTIKSDNKKSDRNKILHPKYSVSQAKAVYVYTKIRLLLCFYGSDFDNYVLGRIK